MKSSLCRWSGTHCTRPLNHRTLRRDASSTTTTVDDRATKDFDDILDSFDQIPLSQDSRDTSRPTKPRIIEKNEQELTQAHRPLSDTEILLRRDRSTRRLGSIGSIVEPHYTPRKLLHHPPDIAATNVSTLVAAQAHLGHSTTLWNPLTQPYIFGVRNGIHIFNLDVTISHLRRAAEVVQGIARNDGNILFVGTRAGQKRSVVEAAARANGFHVFERWIPGTITNGKQVVGHGRVKNLLTKHTRNTAPTRNPELAPNSITPDLVVVLNPLENHNLLRECAKGRVPTIGIIDSDVDPRLVTYSIPANDDSIRCTSLIVGILSRAAAAGREQSKIPDWEQIEVTT